MIILWLWVFRRSQKCHFPLRVHTIKMIYDCWCWPWSSGWSSASQISPLWLFIIYLESFYMWDCFFSPFINLFSHLFILVWTDGYYSLDYNPILLMYFLAQIIPMLVIGRSCSWLLCLFDMPLSVCACVSVSASLLYDTTRCSRIILNISCFCPRISDLTLKFDSHGFRPVIWRKTICKGEKQKRPP